MSMLTIRKFHHQFGGRLKTVSSYHHLRAVIKQLQDSQSITVDVIKPASEPGAASEVLDPEGLIEIINARPDRRKNRTNRKGIIKNAGTKKRRTRTR